MCGIVGFLSSNQELFGDAKEALSGMIDAIRHRGPDDQGLWFDSGQLIGIGHARLSILDLSSLGHQPMGSVSGRYQIVFNGEIYNHLELRKKLPSTWRGSSDTETLLAGFEAWGIVETIKKCVGMFAFAVWDSYLECLTLGRDRIGEKPLYYGLLSRNGFNLFLFASDLRSLKSHPMFNAEVDRDALCLFMRYGYIPSPYSIYQGIKKLNPGTLITITKSNLHQYSEQYWSPDFIETSRDNRVSPVDSCKAVERLDSLLNITISQESIADVPIGVFLSGGIDSSAIAAILQSQTAMPINTFTVGFEEAGFNEADSAACIAKYLGTSHEELYVTSRQALDTVPSMAKIFSEPFSDPSQIPTYLLAKFARKKVSVALSGDGGDELFGGYNRYLFTQRFWRWISIFPVESRRLVANLLLSASPDRWDSIIASLNWIAPTFLKGANKGPLIHKGANVLACEDIKSLQIEAMSRWKNPESLVINGREPILKSYDEAILDSHSGLERMMISDIKSYLPDDVLVKFDRATMAASLEGRSPYLDHRVVEFALSLPLVLKFKNGEGKWILRKVLEKYMPRDLIDRPKMGFGVPISEWLRGPLKEWASELLDETRLRREGFFQAEPIREKWLEHLSGRRNWQDCLWTVLMFQAWLEEN
ncbi:asparagine synthase (glutamine-hydrolyzing) [Polynucleobacter alcilacus]|uniref:asparagine synthase (glutamine-hydrolyzing) n=1 Tax=Polynucleobacter alcilacus TaxID=1819739 RepID=UPI001C0B5FF7|nr:asparagine synthase (glutamine-hydrolyzing) [Polynucleobacter alcilacus]MBU3568199.1 asparagine synthase (glutamine-hydrolyzing) [Polynucleobacter alcilacus]